MPGRAAAVGQKVEFLAIRCRYGTINCFLKRTFAKTGDGDRFYHLYVGTQRNCVVDLTFSVKPGSTEIQDFALEILLQSHVSEITGVQVARLF